MARAWFLRVLLNSSSFSAILRSISCLTWPSSRAALSTLFSYLERALGLLQALLQLFFLSLQPPPLFVQLVDGAATVSKLVQQILNFVREIFVLPANNVQLLVGLLQRRLQAEPFSVEVPAL